MRPRTAKGGVAPMARPRSSSFIGFGPPWAIVSRADAALNRLSPRGPWTSHDVLALARLLTPMSGWLRPRNHPHLRRHDVQVAPSRPRYPPWRSSFTTRFGLIYQAWDLPCTGLSPAPDAWLVAVVRCASLVECQMWDRQSRKCTLGQTFLHPLVFVGFFQVDL